MDWKVFLAAPLAAVMFVAGAQDLSQPKDWSSGLTGPSSKAYAIGVDPQVSFQGLRSLSVQSREAVAPIDFGAAIQYVNGYQGRRVRLSGWLRTAQVKTWAGMYMKVQNDSGEYFFGTRLEGPTEADLPFGAGSGTDINGWTPVSIVADVPDQAGAAVSIGVVVLGQGQAWLSGLRFEEVDRSVPTTMARIGLDRVAYAAKFASRRQMAFELAEDGPQPPKNLSLE